MICALFFLAPLVFLVTVCGFTLLDEQAKRDAESRERDAQRRHEQRMELLKQQREAHTWRHTPPTVTKRRR